MRPSSSRGPSGRRADHGIEPDPASPGTSAREPARPGRPDPGAPVIEGAAGVPTWRPAAVVPVRGLEVAKSRLGEALDPEERASLVHDLLVATLAALTRLQVPTWVVSSDPAVLEIAAAAGAVPLRQEGGDLNAGLRLGREAVLGAGATTLLVVPADLPAVSSGALDEVLTVARRAAETRLVLLVPDRRGEGTNLLVLTPPDVVEFAFGPMSRRRHRAAARAAGARYLEVEGPLRLDLDTADDLVLAEPLLLERLHAH